MLRRVQVTLLAGAVVFFSWGLVIRFAIPDSWDSWTLRSSLSAASLLAYLASVYWGAFRKKIVPIFNGLLVFSSFFLWLQLHNNHYGYFHYAIFTVSASAITVVALSFRGSVMLALFQSALVLAGPLLGAATEPRFFAFLFVTLCAIWLPPLMQYSAEKAFNTVAKAGREFSQIINSLHEGLVLQDSKGNIVYFNDAAPLILGLTPDQLLGKTSLDPKWHAIRENGDPLVGPDHPAMVTIRTGEPQIGAIMGIRRPNDELCWLRVNAIPVVADMYAIVKLTRGESVKGGVLCAFEDITDEKEREKELVRTHAQMVDSARLSTLGETAAGIAHEINNPLAIIALRAEVLLEDTQAIAPQLAEDIQAIQASAQRIAKLVKGVRLLSRDASGDPMMPRRLKEMAQETLHMYVDRLKRENIALKIEMDPGLALLCRPSQIGQVFANFVQNSIDAIVDARIGPAGIGAPVDWIRIEAHRSLAGGIVLTIADTGPGIPEAIRKRVLEPFFTTKPPGKGTGLGLSISRSIIHEHIGTLSIEPSEKGAMFRIEFPETVVSQLKEAA